MGSGAAELTAAEPQPLSGAAVTARRWQLLVIAAVVITFDQLTKAWATAALELGEPIEGPFGSSLKLVYNTGSAFSLGSSFGQVFGVVAIGVAIAMVFVVSRVSDRMVVTGLGLIQGGAIGNVIDRLLRDGDGFLGGRVIDFLEIGDWWPVFNFADVAIVVGGVIVVLFGSRG